MMGARPKCHAAGGYDYSCGFSGYFSPFSILTFVSYQKDRIGEKGALALLAGHQGPCTGVGHSGYHSVHHDGSRARKH